MAAPTMTLGTQAGALSSQSLAGGGVVTFDLDLTAKFEGQVQVKDTGGGTVAATNGLKVEAFRLFGAGPTADTVPAAAGFVITTAASTAGYQSFALPTGKYRVKLTNLDATNAVTVEATLSTVDSVA